MTDLYKILICICEVCENRYRKGRTFRTRLHLAVFRKIVLHFDINP